MSASARVLPIQLGHDFPYQQSVCQACLYVQPLPYAAYIEVLRCAGVSHTGQSIFSVKIFEGSITGIFIILYPLTYKLGFMT